MRRRERECQSARTRECKWGFAVGDSGGEGSGAKLRGWSINPFFHHHASHGGMRAQRIEDEGRKDTEKEKENIGEMEGEVMVRVCCEREGHRARASNFPVSPGHMQMETSEMDPVCIPMERRAHPTSR